MNSDSGSQHLPSGLLSIELKVYNNTLKYNRRNMYTCENVIRASFILRVVNAPTTDIIAEYSHAVDEYIVSFVLNTFTLHWPFPRPRALPIPQYYAM